MLQDEMTLTTQIVDRSPLESGGYSGNEIERVTLRYADDDAKRAWATSELSWWTRTVDKALETWSPR